jgi:NADH:ubiquinone oxidoreductase subunit C
MLFNQAREKYYLTKFAQDLTKCLGTLIKDLLIINKKIQIKTTPENLKSLLFFLHNHSLCRYTQLQEMICVDTPKAKLRFTITYNLYSIKYNKYLNVSVQTNEVCALPTVTNIYYSAN